MPQHSPSKHSYSAFLLLAVSIAIDNCNYAHSLSCSNHTWTSCFVRWNCCLSSRYLTNCLTSPTPRHPSTNSNPMRATTTTIQAPTTTTDSTTSPSPTTNPIQNYENRN